MTWSLRSRLVERGSPGESDLRINVRKALLYQHVKRNLNIYIMNCVLFPNFAEKTYLFLTLVTMRLKMS
jgi:hypothetical protein